MAMLIGITGKAGAGKDELAKILCGKHGFKRTAFADPLKAAAAVAFGIDGSMFHTQGGKIEFDWDWHMTNRRILQDFGETMCQRFGADFWVKRWLMEYRALQDIVVTDVRKDIEATAIQKLGGVIIQINRECAGLQGDEANHVSERGVSQGLVDWTIFNDGSLDDLADEANKLLLWVKCRG